ncbi:MAG: sel1 repeat family protein [Mediterranea massiliensis]|nr:sel1 repeat family protein [Mediterranea massiliensis]
MAIATRIITSEEPDVQAFLNMLGVEGLVCEEIHDAKGNLYRLFHRPDISTSHIYLHRFNESEYRVSISSLAAYDDLRLYPYFVDSLAQHLNGEVEGMPEGATPYSLYNEDWREKTIADSVALLKATLSITPLFLIEQPLKPLLYINQNLLADMGVTLHSSTPRIYGYLQHLLLNDLLPQATPKEILKAHAKFYNREIRVEVPQHVSIGRVKSWQTDGSETYESYSVEDVKQLIRLAIDHIGGKSVEAVVLNDIATIHQEGIGIEKDEAAAIRWYEAAIQAGDHLYAPSNLGDLYRKGGEQISPSLPKALAAYRQSEDPYAHYRIGQAYEEGWIAAPNKELAMKWYRQAAEEGHHLAIKRLKKEE